MSRYNILIIFLFLLLGGNLKAQIGYGTSSPSSNSVLHLYSQDSAKGCVIPVVSIGKRPAATTTLLGMVVYNVTDSCVQFCNGAKWICLDSIGGGAGTEIDSVNYTNDSLFIYENNKVFKTEIISPLDTSLVDSLILDKADTLYSVISDSLLNDTLWIKKLDSLLSIYGDTVYFNDTSFTLVRDSLLGDTIFLDSLITKLKDSIDSDIDSIVFTNDTLYIFEDGKTIKTYLGGSASGGSSSIFSSNGSFLVCNNRDAKVFDATVGAWSSTSFSTYDIDTSVTSSGNFLVYNDRSARVYNTLTGSWATTSFSTYDIISFIINDGSFLVYNDRTAKVYDATTGTWSSTSFSTYDINKTIISNGNFLVYNDRTAKVYSANLNAWVTTSFSTYDINKAISD